MNVKKYFTRKLKELKDKVVHYDQRAQNPFLERGFEHNPFLGAFSETYIWVENDENDENGQGGSDET